MRVDLNMVVRGDEYVPQVGLEYELGPGVVGKMRYPTVTLQREVDEIPDRVPKGENVDFHVCKVILEGLPEDINADDLSGELCSIVVADFFMFALKISDGLQSRFAKYVPSSESTTTQG